VPKLFDVKIIAKAGSATGYWWLMAPYERDMLALDFMRDGASMLAFEPE
jgi:hypothetical protein